MNPSIPTKLLQLYIRSQSDPVTQLPVENPLYKAIGITLAIISGCFIGCSFIFKKRGLLDTIAVHGEVGAGHKYLSSPIWWIGMILMTLGEAANFGAYAFAPAILVTPLGALSVVISAILSSIFLKERLNFSGKVGCVQCLIGAILIVVHAPESNTSETIPEFFSYVVAPGFIVYSIFVAFVIGYLIRVVSPVYGDKDPIVYIAICSLVGSFLVLSCQGFGSALVYTASHWKDDNQFRQWPMYPLIAFIIITVMMQIHFLNKALNLFSTAIVTPVYYVFFTTSTLVSSAVLFRGFDVQSGTSAFTLLLGFFVIVGGVALLYQYNLEMASMNNHTHHHHHHSHHQHRQSSHHRPSSGSSTRKGSKFSTATTPKKSNSRLAITTHHDADDENEAMYASDGHSSSSSSATELSPLPSSSTSSSPTKAHSHTKSKKNSKPAPPVILASAKHHESSLSSPSPSPSPHNQTTNTSSPTAQHYGTTQAAATSPGSFIGDDRKQQSQQQNRRGSYSHTSPIYPPPPPPTPHPTSNNNNTTTTSPTSVMERGGSFEVVLPFMRSLGGGSRGYSSSGGRYEIVEDGEQ